MPRRISVISSFGIWLNVIYVVPFWTTNFDALATRVPSTLQLTPFEVAIDTQQRLSALTPRGQLLCVSLHGDFRYESLKNTPDELQEQEHALHQAFVEHLRDNSLIVSGYSGRDDSVMQALHTAYSQQGHGSLYWCGYDTGEIPEHVLDLIRSARQAGRDAHFVPTNGFDDLLTRLALHCLEGSYKEKAKQALSHIESPEHRARVPFKDTHFSTDTIIKSNAFQVTCPSEVLTFDLKTWPDQSVWRWLEDKVRELPLVVVPFRRKLLAIGTIDVIKTAFHENVKGPIERTPITPTDLQYEDGAVTHLLRSALVRAMGHAAGLKTDGRQLIWLTTPYRRETVQNEQYEVFESAVIFLRRIGSNQYLIIKPSIEVLSQKGSEVPQEIANHIKLSILGYQHNDKFNKAVNDWRNRLLPRAENNTVTTFEFPPDAGSTFRFSIRRSPAFADIGLPKSQSSRPIAANIRPLLAHH